MTNKQAIYIDYLTAKLMGEEVKTVYQKHGCTRGWMYQVLKDKPLDLYTPVQEHLNGLKTLTKRDKEVQVALIRHLYQNETKSVAQIAKITGRSKANIQIVLFG